MPKAQSIVWDFFVKHKDRVTCMLCSAKLKYNGSTTSLRHHLKAVHPSQFIEAEGEADKKLLYHVYVDLPESTPAAFTSTPTAKKEIPMVQPKLQKNFPRRNIRSIVWDFFEKRGNSATCMLCSAKFVYCRSTTSLRHHVKSKHPIHFRESEGNKNLHHESSSATVTATSTPTSAKKQPMGQSMLQVENLFKQGKLYDAHSSRRQSLDRLLLEMIAMDMLPFSVVEDEGFRRFTKAMDPRYPLPSMAQLTRTMLPELYAEKRKEVINVLKQTSAVSLTTDIWTSRTTHGYMTVTAHCISDDWKMHSFVLETVKMTEAHHSGESIVMDLCRLTKDWSIENKVSAIVTDIEIIDNATNMLSAVGQLDGIQYRSCFGHILNLIVTDSLKKVVTVPLLIEKVKDIVEFFHHNVEATDHLNELQKQTSSNPVDHQPLKLINDVATRWISTYYLLERYIELHTEVSMALGFAGKANLDVAEENLADIQLIIDTLKPFELVAREISTEKCTTTSKIIPIIKILQAALQETNSTLAQQLLQELCTRFPQPEKIFLYAASSYLDPRFKNHVFSDQQALTEIQDSLKSRLESPEPQSAEDQKHSPEETTSCSSLWADFDSKVKAYKVSTSDPCRRPNTEMRRLMEENPISRHQDPLQWWKSHELLFPQLQALAKRYLAIPATSVPPERLFFEAGEMVSHRRASLSDSHIDMVLFLNQNTSM